MSDTKEEVMTTRRTRLSALKSEENSHCNDGSGDEIVRRDLFVVVVVTDSESTTESADIFRVRPNPNPRIFLRP